IRVLAGMASSSFRWRERYSSLASGQLSPRVALDLDGIGFTSCCIRRGIADRPHDSASATHDHRSSPDFAGRTRDAVVAWFAAEVRANRSSPDIPFVANTTCRAPAFATCGLLARGLCDSGGM